MALGLCKEYSAMDRNGKAKRQRKPAISLTQALAGRTRECGIFQVAKEAIFVHKCIREKKITSSQPRIDISHMFLFV